MLSTASAVTGNPVPAESPIAVALPEASTASPRAVDTEEAPNSAEYVKPVPSLLNFVMKAAFDVPTGTDR